MQPADVTTLRQRGNARFQAKDYEGALQAFSLLLAMPSHAAVPGERGRRGRAGGARGEVSEPPVSRQLRWSGRRGLNGDWLDLGSWRAPSHFAPMPTTLSLSKVRALPLRDLKGSL
jgi:hypothetical protein